MKDNRLIDAIGMIKDEFIEEAHKKNRFKFAITWSLVGKLLTGVAVVILLINIIPFNSKSAYSTSSGAADSYYYEAKMDEEASYYDGAVEPSQNTSNFDTSELRQNKKLILNARMNVETKNLDELMGNLSTLLEKYGAYIQSSTISSSGNSSRSYDATIRIPSDKYSEFLNELKGSGNVSYYSEETKDITDTYTDLEARLRSLKAEEEKVLEFYDRAQSLEDLMSVEERITQIRYEIDYIETQLKNYDLLIAYSTLTLHVQETVNYTQTSTSFSSRLIRAFKNGFHNFISTIEDILIDLAYDIYTIIFVVLLIALGYFIYKKIRNRKRNKK